MSFLNMAKLYTKEKVIGSGSFVWLVKSRISDGYYVMKELNLSSKNAKEIQQCMVEVTVLSRCRHSNIIGYKDAIVDQKNEMLYIIMEYADGGDLYSAIVNQANVPFKEHIILTWFTQISLALQYLHHKSILHRDLSTKNIFLTQDNQIKLGDFGFAKCLMERNELATTTVGTPCYLSPEICNRLPYNHKSDIWALGCVLFEIAALSYPFQACNFPELVGIILTGKREEFPSYCSSVVRDLVDLLLVKDPEKRPSADDILDLPCLQPYLSDLLVMQNTATTSAPKILNKKKSLRQHSLCYRSEIVNKPVERRASLSSTGEQKIKKRIGFSNKLKSVSSQKIVSPVLPMTELKDRAKSNKNSDFDYEDAIKYILKTSESETTKSSVMTTQKYSAALISELDASIVSDEVFDNSTQNKESDKSNNSSDSPFCQNCMLYMMDCQKYMLHMLWKNRIRGSLKPLVPSDETVALIQKLKFVFGEDLFHKVYQKMASNWESSDTYLVQKSLNDVTSSLTCSQLQHIPLMMQLIQLNLMPK